MNEKVSVVILTRNRCESLERALQATSRQDYPNFEILVVDNGSTDNTRQIADAYKTHYIFSPAAAGIGASRQMGVENATGDIIAMCDDDCAPEPGWLQNLVCRLSADTNLALLGGEIINVGFADDLRFKGKVKLTPMNGKMAFAKDAEEAEFYGNANLAFKKAAVQAIGGYDPFYRRMAELDLVQRLRASGFHVAFEPSAAVRHFNTGVSYKRGRLFFDSQLMRLYFFLKHFRPASLGGWIVFALREAQLFVEDVYRWTRAFAAMLLRFRLRRFPALVIDLFNILSARIAVPWLLWRTQVRKKAESQQANSTLGADHQKIPSRI